MGCHRQWHYFYQWQPESLTLSKMQEQVKEYCKLYYNMISSKTNAQYGQINIVKEQAIGAHTALVDRSYQNQHNRKFLVAFKCH